MGDPLADLMEEERAHEAGDAPAPGPADAASAEKVGGVYVPQGYGERERAQQNATRSRLALATLDKLLRRSSITCALLEQDAEKVSEVAKNVSEAAFIMADAFIEEATSRGIPEAAIMP